MEIEAVWGIGIIWVFFAVKLLFQSFGMSNYYIKMRFGLKRPAIILICVLWPIVGVCFGIKYIYDVFFD